MINWLKNLWRKWFVCKTGSYETELPMIMLRKEVSLAELKKRYPHRPAYDPSQDEERIMRGEEESYFD